MTSLEDGYLASTFARLPDISMSRQSAVTFSSSHDMLHLVLLGENHYHTPGGMKRSTSFAQEPMQLDLDREDGKISTAIEMILFSSSILFLGNE